MAEGYEDWKIVAYVLADSGTGLRVAACDSLGRLRVIRVLQTAVVKDETEAQTWDASITSLLSNLNRIRNQIVTITGEAWGTVSHSIAAIWAKFHATTGHTHTGAAGDAPTLDHGLLTGLGDNDHPQYALAGEIDHGTLTGLGDDDHTIYIKADGTRAFSGNQSMGTKKITSLGTPTADADASTKKYVDDRIGGVTPVWGNWSPTVTFSDGVDVSAVTLARYSAFGSVILFNFCIYIETSGALDWIKFLLPYNAYPASAFLVFPADIVLTTKALYGTHPRCWVDLAVNSKLAKIDSLGISADSFTGSIFVSGLYEQYSVAP